MYWAQVVEYGKLYSVAMQHLCCVQALQYCCCTVCKLYNTAAVLCARYTIQLLYCVQDIQYSCCTVCNIYSACCSWKFVNRPPETLTMKWSSWLLPCPLSCHLSCPLSCPLPCPLSCPLSCPLASAIVYLVTGARRAQVYEHNWRLKLGPTF